MQALKTVNYCSVHYRKHLSNLESYCSFAGGYTVLVFHLPYSEPALLNVLVADMDTVLLSW